MQDVGIVGIIWFCNLRSSGSVGVDMLFVLWLIFFRILAVPGNADQDCSAVANLSVSRV